HTANLNLHDLNLLWGRRHEKDGAIEPKASSALARRALELGEPLLACDICAEAGVAPGISAVVLAQLRKVHGLALARSGALDVAREIAEELLAGGESDEESLGLAGRIHKDLWQRDPQAPD